MGTRFTKVLVHLLVLAITLLPVPSAFSMPQAVADSSEHCAQGMMQHDEHAMTQQQSLDMTEDVLVCQCCAGCDGDCMGCSHVNVTAITLDVQSIEAQRGHEIYNVTPQHFATRNTSPPSRPPLLL